MLETAVALGHMPVAACELIRYRADIGSPEIPDHVTDLGLRGSPNYELLQLVRPDLILSSPFYVQHEARLQTIAPVLSLPFYVPGEPPVGKAIAALAGLGDAIGDPAAAVRARAEFDDRVSAISARLARFRDRPVALINIGDARHVRAFGFDSLFGDMLARLGLRNAWSTGTRFSFRAPLPVESLADMSDARLLILGDVPVEARAGLSRSVLWQHLPAVAERRIYSVSGVNPYGGLPSALHFAALLADAFEAGPETA